MLKRMHRPEHVLSEMAPNNFQSNDHFNYLIETQLYQM